MRRPKSKCTILVDKYRSLETAISESNLTVLHVYRLLKLYHKQKIGGAGGKLMSAFTVALKDPYDPYGTQNRLRLNRMATK